MSNQCTRITNALLFSVLSIIGLYQPCFAEPLSRLVFESTVFDFGAIEQGSVVAHSFSFKNQGDADLIVRRVAPDCGCTVAQLEKEVYAPGESGVIDVTFDSTGFWGNKVKSLRVYSNDPRQPSKVLTVQGVVVRDVQVTPARLYLGTVRKGSDSEKSFTILMQKDSEITVRSVSTRSKHIQITTEDLVRSNKTGKKISVRLLPEVETGIFRERIVIKTSSKKNPVVTVPVFARITGDLELRPADVSFGLVDVKPDRHVKGKAKLINMGDNVIEIKSLKTTSTAVSVSYETITKGKEFILSVEVNPQYRGSLKEKIKITTNHPDVSQREVVLPVFGIIAERGD